MKTTTLVSLVGVAFISLAQPSWARGGGGGHFGGGAPHFSGGGAHFNGGGRFGGGPRFYGGGPRFSSFGARQFQGRPRAFAGSGRTFRTPSVRSSGTLNRQPGQFGSTTRRQVTGAGTRTFNSSNRRMDIVAERHGGNWHRDWDRRRAHFFHNRFFVFDDGFWFGLDNGFYPYDYYDYGYGDPYYYDYGSNESADPYSDGTVSAAQSALAGQGYYRGPIDGVYGPQTRAALTRYQTDHKLRVTGGLDSGTLQALGATQTANN